MLSSAFIHEPKLDNSLKRDLSGDEQSEYPNRETREVIDAQWVEVGPTPLPAPPAQPPARPPAPC